MIITLTANPSHDRTVTLASPCRAAASSGPVGHLAGRRQGRQHLPRVRRRGRPVHRVLPARKDDPFVLELLASGIDCRPVPHPGDLRVNITISEPDGTTTKLNSPGPAMTLAVLADLTEALRRRAQTADWVVLAGSLPPEHPGRVVRRAGRSRCATPEPGSPSTPATRP